MVVRPFSFCQPAHDELTCSYCIVDINVFNEATESELVPTRIGKDSISKFTFVNHFNELSLLIRYYSFTVVLFESSMMCTITEFGIKYKKGEHEASMWDGLAPNFLKHVDQINEELKAAKLPVLARN